MMQLKQVFKFSEKKGIKKYVFYLNKLVDPDLLALIYKGELLLPQPFQSTGNKEKGQFLFRGGTLIGS